MRFNLGRNVALVPPQGLVVTRDFLGALMIRRMPPETTPLQMSSPAQGGFTQPAEWERHDACWLAWPSHGDLWLDALAPVQDVFVQFARAIADPDPVTGIPRGERLEILVLDAEREKEARERLSGLGCRFHQIPFGDIWLRDTAPVFVTSADARVAPICFGFNGWGEKWILPHDALVSSRIAAAVGPPSFHVPCILEGGSIEVDGEGTLLTTTQCLLNENRNPLLSRAEIEKVLGDALGVSTVLWLGDGLQNDHTDGHVDTVARFVAPGAVVTMAPGRSDPNQEALETILCDLSTMKDARGRRLDVTAIPSPGEVRDEDGNLMPASYVNFYIANTAVIVPVYGVPGDDAAVRGIGELFPGRRVVPLPAKDLLLGGGAFHCISQQQPSARTR